MKQILRIMTITSMVALASSAAFGQQDKKAAAARKDLSKAKTALHQAKTDSTADYQKFKTEAELKINENQKEIAVLKTEKAHDTKEIKMKYDREVGLLDEKNDALKSKIASAGMTETSKWTTFKHDFNREMDDLGHSITAMTARNKTK